MALKEREASSSRDKRSVAKASHHLAREGDDGEAIKGIIAFNAAVSERRKAAPVRESAEASEANAARLAAPGAYEHWQSPSLDKALINARRRN